MKRFLLVLGLLLLEPAAALADGSAHPVTAPGPTLDALGEHEAPREGTSPTQSASSMQERPQLPIPKQVARRPPPAPGLFEKLLGGYTEEKANFFKITFAVLLIALISWGVVLDERKQGKRWLKQRRRAIAALGILGVAGWFNYGKFHAGTFVHVWEHYHYYVGAKYFPELRYARLYECSAIAETEMGRRHLVEKRMVRDIAETNLIGPTADILAHPERCKQHFTPERWDQFKRDVAFFVGRMGGEQWERSQKDHGFNGTPWWSVAGTFLANRVGPASNATMNTLALVDPVLILLMFAAIWWAFGVEIFAVAGTFFAVNFPSRYWWNGGAFLRYDYLAASVIGICLLKKARPAVGGGLLAYGAALRIFPLFFALGPAVQAAWRWFREKSLPREHRRILLGAALATAILVPASFLVGRGGPEIIRDFTHNTLKHSDTPLTNHMGLRTMMSWRVRFGLGEGDDLLERVKAGITFDNAKHLKDQRLDDPFRTWKERRLANYRQVLPLFLLINLALLWGIWRVTRDEPAWVAAALSGVVLIGTATELTCYYYAFMIPGAFLMEKKKDYGLWLVLLGIGTHAITRLSIWDDDKYVLMSLASVLYGASVVWDMYKDKRALVAAAGAPVAELAPAQAAAAPARKRKAR